MKLAAESAAYTKGDQGSNVAIVYIRDLDTGELGMVALDHDTVEHMASELQAMGTGL